MADKEEALNNSIKNISDVAGKLTGWAVSIIGGTILIILSSSYYHPPCPCEKIFYLIFIPGWILLFASIYFGTKTMRRSIAADLFTGNEENLKGIFKEANKEFKNQLDTFKFGLTFFGIWLIIYLLWWVFSFLPSKP